MSENFSLCTVLNIENGFTELDLFEDPLHNNHLYGDKEKFLKEVDLRFVLDGRKPRKRPNYVGKNKKKRRERKSPIQLGVFIRKL